MANLSTNIALSKETLQHFAKLVELTKQPTQELAERLFKEAIDREMEDFLLSVVANEYDVEGAETVRSEDVDWNTLLSS
ncbi:hypothetical protein RYF71_04580 [Wolbachia endosymbiont of Drosophila malagassya]|nr:MULTISPECIES: hypothetical protein [Wolbachia]MDE5059509.1 hypothetical protein [Wolbachia endosymbiont of Drosophila burlai]MDU8941279.1 hypothetical protein [Wolbachia endosymbiont of Drosophila malagassya]QWE32168.1 hypothetical protein wTei_03060 [Wolbachia endosymbiont of Drosophila simulans]TLW82696.1 hypothetical protein FFT12_06065 [Wolbachia endosymbiont of Drosophila teissieri]UID81888.1 hypothetical protein J4T77_05630 [Wolbachia endosymbiont of Drosophila innubila]BEP30804.1 MA